MSEAAKYGLGAAVMAGGAFAVRTAFSSTPLGKDCVSYRLRTSALVIAGINAVGFVITAITKVRLCESCPAGDCDGS